MGNFTEVYINCRFNKYMPSAAITVLNFLFNEGERPTPEELERLNHPYFSSSGWDGKGKSASMYHSPVVTNNFYYCHTSECYYLTSRFDLKTYDNEIQQFSDWILPFIDDYMTFYRSS